MFSGLELTLFLLGAAVLGVVVFRMFHLPPMLGYLVVGIVIGPHGLGFAEDNETTHALAEFGVVFLMFSIGLEFSLPKLSSMRHIVFGLGVAQVLATIAVAMVFGWSTAYILPQLHNISWPAAFALGGALAMSSTAIVSKLLTERLELETEHGRRILGILLFQDLALVPLLIIVPALAKNTGNLAVTLGWATTKAVVVLALLLFFGQKLMRSWLQIVGMLISETEYKHQVEEDIKSFRDVLLGLFFITIGMLLNVHLVLEHWWLVLLLLIGPVLLKFVLIAGLAKLFGSTTGVALRTGLALAQAGEFGFVLLNQAGGLQLMDPLLIQVILASMVLSMLAAPFILAKSDAIVMKLSANEWMLQSLALTQLATRTMSSRKHVIIAGFGRSGQSLAKLLDEEGIPYHALEMDPDLVHDTQVAGANVSYGDAARRESLVAAGIHRAAALVVTYASTPSALKVLHHANELVPTLPVIVRSHDDADLDKLLAAGATEVVPEALEGSLMLASHALVMLGVPLRRVVHRVQRARDERYTSLRGYFHGASDVPEDNDSLHVRLESVVLGEGASAIGKTLYQVALEQFDTEVTMLRRGKLRVEFTPDTQLQTDDILVLRGTAENILKAEKRLLKK